MPHFCITQHCCISFSMNWHRGQKKWSFLRKKMGVSCEQALFQKWVFIYQWIDLGFGYIVLFLFSFSMELDECSFLSKKWSPAVDSHHTNVSPYFRLKSYMHLCMGPRNKVVLLHIVIFSEKNKKSVSGKLFYPLIQVT